MSKLSFRVVSVVLCISGMITAIYGIFSGWDSRPFAAGLVLMGGAAIFARLSSKPASAHPSHDPSLVPHSSALREPDPF